MNNIGQSIKGEVKLEIYQTTDGIHKNTVEELTDFKISLYMELDRRVKYDASYIGGVQTHLAIKSDGKIEIIIPAETFQIDGDLMCDVEYYIATNGGNVYVPIYGYNTSIKLIK